MKNLENKLNEKISWNNITSMRERGYLCCHSDKKSKISLMAERLVYAVLSTILAL